MVLYYLRKIQLNLTHYNVIKSFLIFTVLNLSISYILSL